MQKGAWMERQGEMSGEQEPMGIGLRLVQGYYLLTLALGLLFAAFSEPNEAAYDLSMLRAVLQMSTSTLAVWMIQRRFSVAIPVCAGTTGLCMVLAFIDSFFLGGATPVFDLMGTYGAVAFICVEYLLAAAVMAYLLYSKHAVKVLDAEFDNEPEGPGHSWDIPFRERIRSWTWWRDIIMYFIVFSFLGHWAEILFCRLIIAGVFMGDYDFSNAMLWDQWLFPFSAEGTALAMVVLLLHPLKEWLLKRLNGRVVPALVVSFLANALVCTSIDFGTGMVANQNYELWDYRELPFNFMGQVCLQNSMVYSIAATLIVWVVYPLMDTALRRMPRGVADALFFLLVGLYAYEAVLHFVVPM